MKTTVAIPTYKRPEYLGRAVQSVLEQTLLPDELLIVSRVDDEPTNLKIEQIVSDNSTPIIIRNLRVIEPGFLPPVIRSIDEAQGEILVLLDDDATAHPTWLDKILEYYNDPSVAGVGGRCVNYVDGIIQHYAPAKRVGQLSWFGRSVGNMYRDCSSSGAIDVDFLMGGNMSYRLDLLRCCKPDERIGNNVAFHWEVDVGQQVKRLGYRILFDEAIRVDHHSAPREIEGLRTVNYDGSYWHNYNYALLMRKHLSVAGFAAYLIYTFLFGGTGSPGLAFLLYSTVRGKKVPWHAGVVASIRGRFDGALATRASLSES